VVLAIARALAERVNQQPGYRAMLVRKGDYFIPLHKRRDIARAARADLFVSIHADAFTHSRAFGSSVYALSPRGATSVSAAFLAERENGADLIGGVNLGAKDDVLAGVLTDLSMTATMDASLGVGSRVLGSMGRVSRLHKRRVEQAGFVVLWRTTMPSVLVETGYLTNANEEKYLASAEGQEEISEAIFKAFTQYKEEIETVD
jgi:N-acetylmuramoyl-L-alanine amidase